MEPCTGTHFFVCQVPARLRCAFRLAACCFGLALPLAWFGSAAHAVENDSEHWPYRIERGDTLIGVRDQMLQPGADWRVLQRLNRVANPRRLVPGSRLLIPLSLLREREVAAEVLLVQGAASVQRAGSGADVQALTGGDTLATGDSLRTGAQSSAVLRFGDGKRLLLRPDRQRAHRPQRAARSQFCSGHAPEA